MLSNTSLDHCTFTITKKYKTQTNLRSVENLVGTYLHSKKRAHPKLADLTLSPRILGLDGFDILMIQHTGDFASVCS